MNSNATVFRVRLIELKVSVIVVVVGHYLVTAYVCVTTKMQYPLVSVVFKNTRVDDDSSRMN